MDIDVDHLQIYILSNTVFVKTTDLMFLNVISSLMVRKLFFFHMAGMKLLGLLFTGWKHFHFFQTLLYIEKNLHTRDFCHSIAIVLKGA